MRERLLLMVCVGKQRRPRSFGSVALVNGMFQFNPRQQGILTAASRYWIVLAFNSEDAQEAITANDDRIRHYGGPRNPRPQVEMFRTLDPMSWAR